MQPAPTATKPGRKPRIGSRKSTSAYIYGNGKLRVCALHHDFCEHRVHKAQPSAARSAPFYLSSLLQAPARAQPREPAASCGSRGKKTKSSTDTCFADAETSPTAPAAETLSAAAAAGAGAPRAGDALRGRFFEPEASNRAVDELRWQPAGCVAGRLVAVGPKTYIAQGRAKEWPPQGAPPAKRDRKQESS